jgi:hypothetical protein
MMVFGLVAVERLGKAVPMVEPWGAVGHHLVALGDESVCRQWPLWRPCDDSAGVGDVREVERVHLSWVTVGSGSRGLFSRGWRNSEL